MSLRELREATPHRRTMPREFTAAADLAAGVASVNVTEIPEDEAGWRSEIKKQTGLTVPDDRVVVLTGVRLWNMGAREHRHLTFKIERRAGATSHDLDALLDTARKNARRTPPKRKADLALTRTRLVGFSDEQLHKVDRLGGTPEFFERLGVMLGKLDAEIVERPCDDAVVMFGGDMTEGFENHGGQAFTNDGSMPDMIVTATQYMTHVITWVASRHQRTRVLVVPSNHGAWRKGKDYLGKPSDDFGIAVAKIVQAALARDPRFADIIEFYIPSEWEVSVAVPVRDDVIALTHGHVGTTGPAAFPKWFAGQCLGDSPISGATVVFSGHFHHLRVVPLGAVADRPRVHIQMPAMDGGSSHFTNATGEWSPPGITTAIVNDATGLDHLRVLTA